MKYVKSMTGNEIRTRFLEFFKSKEHLVMPSAPLIPHDDPTLLLVGAGMAPFKPFFTGKIKPPIRAYQPKNASVPAILKM